MRKPSDREANRDPQAGLSGRRQKRLDDPQTGAGTLTQRHNERLIETAIQRVELVVAPAIGAGAGGLGDGPGPGKPVLRQSLPTCLLGETN